MVQQAKILGIAMSLVFIPEGKFKVIVGSQNGEIDKIR